MHEPSNLASDTLNAILVVISTYINKALWFSLDG